MVKFALLEEEASKVKFKWDLLFRGKVLYFLAQMPIYIGFSLYQRCRDVVLLMLRYVALSVQVRDNWSQAGHMFSSHTYNSRLMAVQCLLEITVLLIMFWVSWIHGRNCALILMAWVTSSAFASCLNFLNQIHRSTVIFSHIFNVGNLSKLCLIC